MADGIQPHTRRERFRSVAQQLWEDLVTQIKLDAGKMNEGLNPKSAIDRPALKGTIEINGRELTPGRHEIHIDKLAFPARDDGYFEGPTSLTVKLDIEAEAIRTINKDTPEAQRWNTVGVIELHLADDDHLYSECYNGEEYLMMEMTPEKLSESILSAFLPHHRRTCGNR